MAKDPHPLPRAFDPASGVEFVSNWTDDWGGARMAPIMPEETRNKLAWLVRRVERNENWPTDIEAVESLRAACEGIVAVCKALEAEEALREEGRRPQQTPMDFGDGHAVPMVYGFAGDVAKVGK